MRESITKKSFSFVGPTLEDPHKKEIFCVGSCSLNQLHLQVHVKKNRRITKT